MRNGGRKGITEVAPDVTRICSFRERDRCRVLITFARQRLHELHQCRDLILGQVERLYSGAQTWVRMAAQVVVLDDFAQRFQRAIVHEGRMLAHIAQRRRLEGALVFLLFGHGKTAFVLEFFCRRVPADAEIVKTAVAEILAHVALSTLGSLKKYFAALLDGG